MKPLTNQLPEVHGSVEMALEIMVHSFELLFKNNGNYHVKFMVDNKVNTIIFQKGTKANEDFLEQLEVASEGVSLQNVINRMRNKYLFKANANNKSIFRPIDRTLILK